MLVFEKKNTSPIYMVTAMHFSKRNSPSVDSGDLRGHMILAQALLPFYHHYGYTSWWYIEI